MRITDSMMTDQFLRDANASLNRVSDAQNIVDSTKRINGIADDPLSTVASLKARNNLSNLANYQNSISAASSSLTENESATQGLNEIVQSAYELVVSAVSAKTDDDKSVIADEISSLRDEVLSIANSTLATKYLFSGNSNNKPFSVDNAGHLTYNGIDLTKYSLNEEYQNNMQAVTDGTTEITSLQAELSGSTSDYDAQNKIIPDIIDQLDQMITGTNTAIQAAKQFGGVNTATLDDLQALVLSDSTTSLTSIKQGLENEISKQLDGGSGASNTFSQSACNTVLADFSTLAAALSTALGTTVSQLDVSSMDSDLTVEQSNIKELLIGDTQKIQVSANGLELLGTGTSNIYYVLDKCVNILNGDMDSGLLSDMPTTLQSTQSNILSLVTKIGSSKNRLSMISGRYTSSKATYTEMKSDAEDADMAEAIVNLTTAKTVYNAALAAGSKIIQTSLVDFLN